MVFEVGILLEFGKSGIVSFGFEIFLKWKRGTDLVPNVLGEMIWYPSALSLIHDAINKSTALVRPLFHFPFSTPLVRWQAKEVPVPRNGELSSI